MSVRHQKLRYPNLVSIDLLLKAGQLVEPKVKNQVSLRSETFHQEWVSLENSLDLLVDAEKFSSDGFRYAFLVVTKDKEKWVINKYHERAVHTITGTLNLTLEDHTRKQAQTHSVRHLTKVFSNKVLYFLVNLSVS
ncbi:Hypothetical predicted protein [Paramuricea clavata]|uniref:Uncharacterized protein n=1 Tax=Paramuricea clavata TaxID=317549 RepID=A0A6S7GX29_PARCT|nr:Hypothetical predicted protein [Paramuricea clavata]